MIVRQVSNIIEKSEIKYFNHVLPRYFSIDINEGPAKRQERKLREWQKKPERGPKSFFALWDKSAMQPKAKRDNSFGRTDRGELPDTSIASVKETFKSLKTEMEKGKQMYVPARLTILGSDLAIAHFLLHRGGKIKFRGNDQWVKPEEKTIEDLPKRYDPRYIVSAIDCSEMNLYYEGLLSFENLTRVKWASFRGNQVLDEWSLDRIVGQIPCLEYLDISNCPKLNERGLECLYKLFYLKTLIVTNHEKSAAFELTCLMLEDCNPNLKCEILQPDEKSTLNLEAEATS